MKIKPFLFVVFLLQQIPIFLYSQLRERQFTPKLKSKINIVKDGYSTVDFFAPYILSKNKLGKYIDPIISIGYDTTFYYDNEYKFQVHVRVKPIIKEAEKSNHLRLPNANNISWDSLNNKILPNFIVDFKNKLNEYVYVAFYYDNEQLCKMEISKGERMELYNDKWKLAKQWGYFPCEECGGKKCPLMYQLFILDKTNKWKYLGKYTATKYFIDQDKVVEKLVTMRIGEGKKFDDILIKIE